MALLISACASSPKCVRVSYFDYGDIGCIQHIYQFQGKYYPGALGNNKGIVLVDKFLGDGNSSMFEQCKEPADLKEGWYTVTIDEGKGTWILNGEGYKGQIDIFPNVVTQTALSKVIKSKGVTP
jgi:hypothetical protein